MSKTIIVSYVDGRPSEEAHIRPAASVAYERQYNQPIEASATSAYWMAWFSLKPGVPFDDWIDLLDDIDVPDESTATGPLPQGLSAG